MTSAADVSVDKLAVKTGFLNDLHYFFCNGHGTVLASCAADRYVEICPGLFLVKREDGTNQFFEARYEITIALELLKIILYLIVRPRFVFERLYEIRIREEPHVHHYIGVHGDTLLESE